MSGQVKGRCPGALRPMESGDGLVVRVRPHGSRLTAEQALALADLAETHGNGLIDLGTRAHLQLRGVRAEGLPALHEALATLGLLAPDPESEARRNILTTPTWQDEETPRLVAELEAVLTEAPPLPPKFGFALDTGARAVLGGASADIRIERGANGLILRADGMATGTPVTRETAATRAVEMAHWFAAHRGEATRMARLIATGILPPPAEGIQAAPRTASAHITTEPQGALPEAPSAPPQGSPALPDAPSMPPQGGPVLSEAPSAPPQADPAPPEVRSAPPQADPAPPEVPPTPSQPAAEPPLTGPPLAPGATPYGLCLALPFGQMSAATLRALAVAPLRLTPWRSVVVEGVMAEGPGLGPNSESPTYTATLVSAFAIPEGVIADPSEPLLRVAACTGAPGCASASVATRALARRLAPLVPEGRILHVSGCAKGCARPGPADATLTGRAGRFDLIPDGPAGGTPIAAGLTDDQIPDLLRGHLAPPP